ncbi:MAG: D-tyrosyl-tRNA(Tyr) deacylase [Deltaproteobacteria bacterium]|nr:D-tyrosyl-tRNA(Tyr) deacylase [Deltaproteobacteria bacterium]
MRAVVQRVRRARVVIDGAETASMGRGLFVLVGLKAGDTVEDLDWIAGKASRLRVFEDRAGKMNLGAAEVGGGLAVVSEFTLYGDASRGNRPSYSDAMPVEEARAFWPRVEARFAATGLPCVFGRFQAMMDCEIVNDGPVTLILDSADRL